MKFLFHHKKEDCTYIVFENLEGNFLKRYKTKYKTANIALKSFELQQNVFERIKKIATSLFTTLK